MAWRLQAMGIPSSGDRFSWKGTLSSRVLPHAVLACRAAILNLLADGVSNDIRSWQAVGAITHPRAANRPITVAYTDVVVPAEVTPLTEETFERKNIFELLVKMKDPGVTIAELEALVAQQRFGRDPISRILEFSSGRPTPTLYELLTRRII